jgi:hypothetical protein
MLKALHNMEGVEAVAILFYMVLFMAVLIPQI